MESFNLTKPVAVVNASANADAYYGPFKNLPEACQEVPQVLRLPGRTVGILENNAVVDYWWKAGIEDTDLVPKNQPHGIYNYETTVVEVPNSIETVVKKIVIPTNTFKNLDVLNFDTLATTLVGSFYNTYSIYITQDEVLDNSNKLFKYENSPVLSFGSGYSVYTAKANGIIIKNNQLICMDFRGNTNNSSSKIQFDPSLQYNLVVTSFLNNPQAIITEFTTELLTLKKTN